MNLRSNLLLRCIGLLLFAAGSNLSAWESSDLKIYPTVQSVSFPSGFTIVAEPSATAKPVKSVPGPESANVAAHLDVDGARYYVTDWSYDRFRQQGIRPNWIRGQVANAAAAEAMPDPPKAKIVEPTEVDAPSVEPAARESVSLPAAADGEFGTEHYRFRLPQAQSLLSPSLSRIDNRELIYADDVWIVVGQFLRVPDAGGNHHLSLYSASTLQLVAEMTVANYVYCMDWSPERGQFLLATSNGVKNERYVKYPEDVAQALVLVDPRRQKLERVAVWRGEESSGFASSDCRFHWIGNEIHAQLYAPHGDFFPDHMRLQTSPPTPFQSDAFRDVSLKFLSRNEDAPDLRTVRQDSIKKAGLDLAGLTGFASRGISFSSNHEGALTPDPFPGKRIVQAMANGFALDLDLKTLRLNKLGTPGEAVQGVGTFEDGTIHYVQGDQLFLRKPGSAVDRVVDLSAIIPDADFRSEGLAFGDQLAYYAAPTRADESTLLARSISPDGNIAVVGAPISIGNAWNWSVDARRKSIAFVTGTFDGGRFWREYELASGKLKSEPFEDQTGKGLGGNGRKFGIAPDGWSVTSSCDGAYTGGRDYFLEVTNLTSGESLSSPSSQEYSANDPLEIIAVSDRSARVIAAGADKIYLLNFDLPSRNVSREFSWNWDEANGTAFFDRSDQRLFVPVSGGYEVFALGVEKVEKVYDLLFRGEEEYAVVLPNGFYACTPGCEQFLKLPIGDETLSASVLAPWRNRPAEVLSALGGDREVVSVLGKVTERWLTRLGMSQAVEPSLGDIPKVVVTRPLPLWSSQSDVVVPLHVSAAETEVQGISIRVNGVLVADALPAATTLAAGESGDFQARLALSPGQNWIEITALDQAQRSSEPVRFRILLEASDELSVRYVVALGVSRYANDSLNLELAAKDAHDIVTMFKQLGETDGVPTRTLLLVDEQVVPAAMEEVKEFLSNASERDEILFFAAGHGLLDADLNYVFGAHTLDPDQPASSGILLDEILAAIRGSSSRRCLVLLDTCQAGFVGEREEMLLTSTGASNLPASVRSIQRKAVLSTASSLTAGQSQRFIEELFSLPGGHRGIHLIGASSAEGFAFEIDGIENGIFTSAVIEAVKQSKANLDGDQAVDVNELRRYLATRVRELTGNKQKPSVVAFENDQPFMLRQAQTHPQAWVGERYPQTRLRILSDADLKDFDFADSQYAINEMFARHGAAFQDAEITRKVARFSWYHPDVGTTYDSIEERDFTDTERANLITLARHRDRVKP